MHYLKTIGLAAGVLAGSAAVAAAATTTHALNLRAGPGTSYNVITAMPGGAFVDIENCSDGWCAVSYRGREGYASARYLAEGDGVRTTVIYDRPDRRRYRERWDDYDYDYDYSYYDYGPRYRYGYGPRFSARFGPLGVRRGWDYW